jgi:hypothetical protein
VSPAGVLPGPRVFTGWLNDGFSVEGPGEPPVTLVLRSVEDLSAPDGYEAFSLIFIGPHGSPLSQERFQLTRAGSEPITLFLVPIARDDEGFRYQAIVNRPTAEEGSPDADGHDAEEQR